MYFKIALNNVKKSFKDYGVYFLTLTFAVCVFYAFNSIGNQNAMNDISKSTASYIGIVKNAMSMVSIFVSVILGGLIIYANNFLIKRRKKELGIYMMLGMGKRKISQILVMETILIGLVSLIVGLGLGIILSQGLSVFTAKLFELSLSQYGFTISIDAIIKTIIYFGIIFILVMIFNVFVINKYKLIDLLIASRKNEKVKLRNPLVSFIIFLIGTIILVVAYYIILTKGTDMSSFSELALPVGLGVVGTFLFFFGIAGFILFIVKKNDRVYLKGLNIFITKQISSKINTNFISMSIISLMLFITIVALSTGLGFKNSMDNNLTKTTPFDATITIMNISDNNNVTAMEALKELNITIPSNYEMASYNTYRSNVSLAKISGDNKWKMDADVIPVSEYNQMMKMEGNPTVNLEDNQALITSDNSSLTAGLNNFIKSGQKLNINGKEYSVENKEVLDRAYQTTGMSINICTIVVPDSAINGLELDSSYLNLDYKNNLEEGNKFVTNLETKYGPKDRASNNYILFGSTRTSVYEQSKGMTTVILFVTIYLGVIFLLTSAAVLALQQLSEASDSIDRYKSLRKIGVSNKMINKSVLIQTLIYFGAPLTLAIVDSIIGLIFVNKFITMFGKENILIPSILTFTLLIIVYIGYFIATYVSYKNVIKEK